uniref:Uncharacterized protein n=1 Tax=Arundo donax TaxID=35708 RepID=A0A0A9EZ10_ARUDO
MFSSLAFVSSRILISIFFIALFTAASSPSACVIFVLHSAMSSFSFAFWRSHCSSLLLSFFSFFNRLWHCLAVSDALSFAASISACISAFSISSLSTVALLRSS